MSSDGTAAAKQFAGQLAANVGTVAEGLRRVAAECGLQHVQPLLDAADACDQAKDKLS